MAGDQSSFHIGNRMKVAENPHINFMFNVEIPKINSLAPITSTQFALGEELTLRCKSITLPSQSIDAIETLFMGTKQYFPGKKTMGGTVTCSFYDTEDQVSSRALYEWSQRIFNYNPDNSTNGGKSAGLNKAALTTPIYVNMMKYNGTKLPYVIALQNCWLQNVEGASLDFGSGDVVAYSVTFQCDYWQMLGPTPSVAIDPMA